MHENTNSNDRDPVSRERLYEEVWAEPITTVALRYNVSGSFLARICTRLKIPRPSRGYWAMVAVGKRMKRPPLPDAQPGDELEWARYGHARVAQLPPPKPPQENSQRRRRHKFLPERHPLLGSAKEILVGVGESRNGFIKPKKYLMVDIVTSIETLDRAMDVANELFLSMERRGHTVMLAPYGQNLRRHGVDERENGGRKEHFSDLWSPSRPTVVFIGTVAFGLTIFEMSENVEVQYQDGKYTRISELPVKKPKRYESYSWRTTSDLPSRRLCVQIYSPYATATWMRQWREAKTGDFPRKLSGIAKELEAEAVKIVKLIEEGERKAEIERKRREAEHLEWLRKRAEERRVEAENNSLNELSQIIDAWAQVKKIEEFFRDAEKQAELLSDQDKSIILERLKLAREMIGCTDALQWLAGWKTPEEKLQESMNYI